MQRTLLKKPPVARNKDKRIKNVLRVLQANETPRQRKREREAEICSDRRINKSLKISRIFIFRYASWYTRTHKSFSHPLFNPEGIIASSPTSGYEFYLCDGYLLYIHEIFTNRYTISSLLWKENKRVFVCVYIANYREENIRSWLYSPGVALEAIYIHTHTLSSGRNKDELLRAKLRAMQEIKFSLWERGHRV